MRTITLARLMRASVAEADRLRDPAERVGAGVALMHLTARHVATLRAEDPKFNAEAFMTYSGFTEDWEQARILSLIPSL